MVLKLLKINKFNFKDIKKIDILFILLLSLITTNWFKGNYLIYIGDQYIPLNVMYDFKNYIYSSWLHFSSTGVSSPQSVAGLFYIGYFIFLKFFGFSLVLSQKILYFSLFSMCGLSMYFLSRTIIKNNVRIVSISSALFYMFNFFALFSFWRSGIASIFLYVTIPLALCLYIKYINNRKNIYGFSLIFILSMVTVIAFVNPVMAVLMFFILFSYLVYFILFNAKSKVIVIMALLDSLYLFLIWLFINIWWILPTVFSVSDGMESATAIGGINNVFILSSSQTSLVNIFRLFGYWPFTAYNSAGDQFFTWSTIYFKPFFVFLSFLFPLLIIISFFKKRIEKISIFLGILFISGLYLMKGINIPFKEYSMWLFLHIPYFGIFRNQYEKFGMIVALVYSVLVGIGFGYLYESLKEISIKISNYTIVILSIMLFGLYMWPYWTGDVIYGGGKGTPSARVIIPNYYHELKNWSEIQNLDYKVISLPHQEGSSYNWEHGYYGSYDPTGNYLSKPLLAQTVNVGNTYLRIYLNNLFNEFNIKNNSGAYYSSITNIKYFIIHNDLNYNINNPDKNINSNTIRSLLSFDKNISFQKSIGKIDIYRMNSAIFLPHFYSPKTTITTSQNLDVFPKIVSQRDCNIRPAIYFRNNQTAIVYPSATSSEIFNSSELTKETIDDTPIIEFKKINPTKYRVIVHHASVNFPLIFSESYNDGWKSYLVGYQKDILNFNETEYKILDGNADDQANAGELKRFIDKGYISSLGNLKEKGIKHFKWESNKEIFDYNEPYQIDFISKNFQDTIQNDNLDNGSFYETWFQKPVDNNQNHLMVNGYANSWNINPNELCLNNAKCVKNADGSYDFELVIEFWPQRLFYIGLFVSGATLIGCLIYVGYDFVKRRKNKKDEIIK